MCPPLVILALAVVFLGGCASPQAPAVVITLEPPKDGMILVGVSGNAKDRGQFWVREDASLATIEDLFAVRPDWASRHVLIVRREPAGQRQLFRMDKMSRCEKEQVKVNHGDEISFVHDRCFGFAPDNRQAATLCQERREISSEFLPGGVGRAERNGVNQNRARQPFNFAYRDA
jgi:hypothetical protein